MKLIFHIVKKDFQRLRLWLVVWAAVLELPLALGLVALNSFPDDQTLEWFEKALTAIVWLRAATAFLLAVVLFQEDSAVRTDAFWLTRPVRRSHLLAAKGIDLILWLVVFPAMASLPWGVLNRLTVTQIVAASIEPSLVFSVAGIAGAMVGSLTERFSRALLWTAVLVAAMLTAAVLFSLEWSQFEGRRDITPLISRAVLALGILLVAAGAATTAQYLLRTRVAVVSCFVFASLCGLAGGFLWKGAPLPRYQPMDFNAAAAQGVEISVLGAQHQLELGRSFGKVADPRSIIGIYFEVKGAPDGVVMRGDVARHRFSWPDLTVERSTDMSEGDREHIIPGLNWPRDAETEAWFEAKRQERPQRLSSMSWTLGDKISIGRLRGFGTALNVPATTGIRMIKDPAAYQANLQIELVQPVIVYETPIHSRTWHRREGYGGHVLTAERNKGTIELRLTATSPGIWWDQLMAKAGRRGTQEVDEGRYIAINRKHAEWIDAHSNRGPSITIGGITIAWHTLTIYAPKVVRAGKWQARPGWTDDLSVGFVVQRPQARFTRKIAVPRLVVDDRTEKIEGRP